MSDPEPSTPPPSPVPPSAAAGAAPKAAGAAKAESKTAPPPTGPPDPPPPDGKEPPAFLAALQAALPGAVVQLSFWVGDWVVITTPERLLEVATWLRDAEEAKFDFCSDVTASDWPARAERFDLVYNLYATGLRQRVRVKTRAADGESVPSVSGVWTAAGWLEREVYDMYGVLFDGNPDLRRILTDYGFRGHPQRKDFPLTGYVELRYSEERKRVVYEPVRLAQDFRSFDFLSPWEGLPRVLPGDEKATGAAAPAPTKQGGG